ncbi:MAG TPA: hypothetical protein VI488_01475 [Candidatus Angelobacter sp.]
MTWIRKFGRRRFLALVLASLSACSMTAQSPAPAHQRGTKAVTRYTDTVYGVVFVYPKHFVLKEGDLTNTDDIGLGYLGSLPMAFVQPGGTRIATVEIPTSSYPNTDFVNAFFSVSIHQGMTAKQCAQFGPEQGVPKTRGLDIHGIRFEGINDSDAAMNHQFSGKVYHGFSTGRCFELAYGLATTGYGVVDGLKHVDDKAIMALLGSILPTVKIAIPLANAVPSRHAGLATPARPGTQIAALESATLNRAGGVLVSSR